MDGRTITYITDGRGKPIVFLPGLASGCALWSEVLKRCACHHRVWAFDLPLYGSHNASGRVYTLHTYHRFLYKLIRYFHIQKPVIVGHSLGSLIALRYAGEHPKSVRALVMVSSPLRDHTKRLPLLWLSALEFALHSRKTLEIAEWIAAQPELHDVLARIIFPNRKKRERALENSIKLQEELRRLPAKSYAKCFDDILREDFRPWLEKLCVPALLIYGTRDAAINAVQGTALYTNIAGAELCPLAAEHYIPSDMPGPLATRLLSFLENHG